MNSRPLATALTLTLLTGCTTAHSSPPHTTALTALQHLDTRGRAPKTGYTRTQFGRPYTDAIGVPSGHNGCSQLTDIRRRDTHDAHPTGRCTTTGGYINDPYTGHHLDPHHAQLEHVVALADAWQTGAQHLTPEKRAALAGDPLNLLMVDGRVNAAKGESDAASWLPPNKGFRCRYAALQIAVKSKYQLWVVPAERATLASILAGCPTQELPDEQDPLVAVPPPKR